MKLTTKYEFIQFKGLKATKKHQENYIFSYGPLEHYMHICLFKCITILLFSCVYEWLQVGWKHFTVIYMTLADINII